MAQVQAAGQRPGAEPHHGSVRRAAGAMEGARTVQGRQRNGQWSLSVWQCWAGCQEATPLRRTAPCAAALDVQPSPTQAQAKSGGVSRR